MKKIFLLFIPFMFFFSCNDEDEHDLTWGYACINASGGYNCVAAVDGPYENLETCVSFCSSNQDKD